LRGTLIALAAIPVSAVMWGLFTGRWTAESRRTRRLQKGAQVIALMRIPVPWVFILLDLAGLAIQRVLPIAIPSAAYVNFVAIPVEEQNLRGVFDDAYQEYGARVGRWP